MADQLGKIEVAVGPMFSGKSEWLVGRLRVHTFAKDKVLAIRYADDERYSDEAIASHNGSTFTAKKAKTVVDIKKLLKEFTQVEVIGVDEMQFFDIELADIFLDLAKNGCKVYACGLDLDFTGKPWESSMKVMALADRVEKLVAVCTVCDEVNATRTQRLIDGRPAPTDSQRVLIGGKDSYTARCILHHEVPAH